MAKVSAPPDGYKKYSAKYGENKQTRSPRNIFDRDSFIVPLESRFYTNNTFLVRGRLFHIYQLSLIKYVKHTKECSTNNVGFMLQQNKNPADYSKKYYIRFTMQPLKNLPQQVFKFSLQTWNEPNVCQMYYLQVINPLIEKYGRKVYVALENVNFKNVIIL